MWSPLAASLGYALPAMQAGPLIVSIAKTIVHSLYDSREKGSNIDATVRRSAGWSLLLSPQSRFSEFDRGKKRSMSHRGQNRKS